MIINGLDVDDPLCRQLISQKDVALGDAYLSFLHTDRGEAIKTEAMESAHAALGSKCFLCQSPDHFAKDCPHRDAIVSLVTRRNDSRGRRGRGCGNGFGSSTQAHTASSIRTSTSKTANHNAGTSKSTSQETAGVASAFLSCDLHTTDIWLCDSGASSSMSSNRSAFLSLKPDRHPICLADGKVIYSKGLGSIRFLLDCGYHVTINNVLYVPLLAVNLFASNRFAKDHCDTHSEMTQYPKHKWVNRRTGAIEFTTTIQHSNLVHLDWKVALRFKSANLSITELHAQLNHMPFSTSVTQIRGLSGPAKPTKITT